MRLDEFLDYYYDYDVVDDDDDNVAFFGNQSTVNLTGQHTPGTFTTIRVCSYVIYCMALALGIPGNIVSTIVWLRVHVASENSSAIYLATLANSDIVILLMSATEQLGSCNDNVQWFCLCALYVQKSTVKLETLLVLGFSVERLIAILRPLQV